MLPRKKHVNTTVFLTPPSDVGLVPIKSNSSEPQGVNLDIGLTIRQLPSLLQKTQELILSTLESLPPDKKKICNDKLTISLKNFQWPEWNKKLGLDLDSIGEVYKDYLNISVWDKYPLLLLHIKTVLAGLDLIYSSGYAKETIPLSWLTIKKSTLKVLEMNSPKTFSRLHIPLAVECMETENSALKPPKQKRTTRNPINHMTQYMSAQVIPLRLVHEQKEYLSTLAKAYNLVYNKSISTLNKQIKNLDNLNASTFRDYVLRHDTLTSYTDKESKFLHSVPYRIKEKAAENVASILKATTTNWTKMKYMKKKKYNRNKNIQRVSTEQQCTYVYKKGVNSNTQCTSPRKCVDSFYCNQHIPKEKCSYVQCNRNISNSFLSTCKIHTKHEDIEKNQCVFTSSKGKKCTAIYVSKDHKLCKRHNVNTKCTFNITSDTICGKPSCGDYCLNHTMITRIKLKYRNRNGNKYICLNERDWDAFAKKMGIILDVDYQPIDKPTSEFVFIYNKCEKQWKMISTIYKDKKITQCRKTLCSLDPGERTPYTMYSFDDGDMFEISCREETEKYLIKHKNRCEKLKECKHVLKYMFSDRDKAKSKLLQQINRAYKKNKAKAFNRMKDAHWKLANWICSNYEYVILPKFRISSLVSNRNRLPKSVKRNILSWNFTKFKDIMCIAAAKYNTKLVLGDEFYTTKCCVKCRRLTDVKATDKIYECRFEDCKFTCPRDFGGSINNGIQYIM